MTKRELCAFVGKSKRTIDNYIASGRLRCGYIRGPNGKTAIFELAAAEALKLELETPMYRATPETATHRQGFAYLGPEPPAPHGLAVPPAPAGPDPLAFATILAGAVRAALPAPAVLAPPPARVKPWLTLDEAAEFSGVPKAWLKRKTREEYRPDGQPNVAVNFGTEKRPSWRFSRDLLKAVAK